VVSYHSGRAAWIEFRTEEGCLGGCNIIEFAMDVELVFGLSFSSLALSFA
jgi:hypothetical protein